MGLMSGRVACVGVGEQRAGRLSWSLSSGPHFLRIAPAQQLTNAGDCWEVVIVERHLWRRSADLLEPQREDARGGAFEEHGRHGANSDAASLLSVLREVACLGDGLRTNVVEDADTVLLASRYPRLAQELALLLRQAH